MTVVIVKSDDQRQAPSVSFEISGLGPPAAATLSLRTVVLLHCSAHSCTLVSTFSIPLPYAPLQLNAMDKDNRDDFTFAKLSDLKMPVTFRMYFPSL